MVDLFAQADSFVPVEVPDAEVQLKMLFLGQGEANELLSLLVKETEWRQEKVQVWGKWHPQPRLVAWYGDEGAAYSYSGSRLTPTHWTPTLLSLKVRIERATGAQFNSVLLNYYRDQHDRMGWHSDDEPELGHRPTIASLSLGDTRIFLLKHKVRRELGTKKIPLTNGSLLVMSGDTQHHWQHAIDRESKPSGPRVNLTFRLIGKSRPK